MPIVREDSLQPIHKFLSDSDLPDREKDSYTLYRLQHACYHQVVLGDTERIWQTLNEPTYINRQVGHTKEYQWSNASIQYGIAHFVLQQGVTIEDDARLSWLVLQAGELTREAIEGVGIHGCIFSIHRHIHHRAPNSGIVGRDHISSVFPELT